MERIVLKTTRIPIWFELGFFNLVALICMIPTLWFQVNTLFWLRPCRDSTHLFLRANQDRLELLAIVLPICLLIEILVLRAATNRDSATGILIWIDYGLKSLIRCLPFLLLIFAMMALPYAKLAYALAGLIGVYLVYSQTQLNAFLSPVWLLQSKEPARLIFKPLSIYLLSLGIGLFLFFLILNNFTSGSSDCAKRSSVKANMHTFQTIVETYAAEHKGKYPASTAQLKQAAQIPDHEYWKEFFNPYNSKSGEGSSYLPMTADIQTQLAKQEALGKALPSYRDVLGIPIYDTLILKPQNAGLVIYDYIEPSRYYIYGLDIDGQIIRDRGQNFYLTNS